MRIPHFVLALFLLIAGVIPAVGISAPASGTVSTAAAPLGSLTRTDDVATRATRGSARTPEATNSHSSVSAITAAVQMPALSRTAEPAAVHMSAAAIPTTTTTTPPTTVAPATTTTTARPKPTTTTTAAPTAESASDSDDSSDDATSSDGSKDAVVAIAKKQIGKAYVYGATGPNAFDCSGFVYWVFNQAGISVPRLTSDGYYAKSEHISRSELQPGDLIIGRGHIGIYVGNGQMVHASTPRGGVKQAPIDAAGTPIGYGRL